MYNLQTIYIVLAVAASSLAQCTPNKFEMSNLKHHHDINTGDIATSAGKINKGRLRVAGGTGCSPTWAGGSYDDSALWKNGKQPKLRRRHGPSKGPKSPKEPKELVQKRRPHGPDENDGHLSYPQNEKRRPHGPDETDGHLSYPQNEKRRAHGPDENDGHLSYPQNEKRRAHGPDENDGHLSYPQNVKRRPHGPDENDGHFSYPQNEKRLAHGPDGDQDDGHFSYPQNEKRHGPSKGPTPPKEAVQRRTAHGPDENDGHFSYPVRRHQPSERGPIQ